MKKNMIWISTSLLFIILIGTLLTACGQTQPPATTISAPGQTATSPDGQSLMQQRCSVCHTTERITSSHKTTAQWTTTVERMVGKGAQLSIDEQQTLINYLAQTYK